jgi:hypothetical protein
VFGPFGRPAHVAVSAVGVTHQMLLIGKTLPIGQMLPIRKTLPIGHMLPIGQILLIRKMLPILPAPDICAFAHDNTTHNQGGDDPALAHLTPYPGSDMARH